MATQTFDPNDIVAGDFPLMHRKVTFLTGRAYKRGDVLGRVSVSDKYKLSLSAAEDGSEDPVAICAVDVDASTGDKTGPAYFTGEFASEKLTYGTGHTAATVDAATRQANLPIFIRSIGAVA